MTDNNTALKKAGLKVTLPRLKILEVLQEPDNHHVSAEDLYKRLIDMGEEIGLATVYRVLNQFDDAGIVTRHNFEGGKSVFELTQQHHHDHLICLDCGKVIEFSDDSIEARQREIAAKHGIRLTNHSLYLYGHCAEGDCREDEHAHEGQISQPEREKPTCGLAFLYAGNKKSESYSSHLFVITANFLPDLITIGFYRLVITGLRCAQTLLIIQYAYTFLVGKMLMLFLFLQHV